MSPLLWFLSLLTLYVLALYILLRTGWMQRLNMSLFGPALMIKTQRGRGILDFFARARGLFDGAASFGIWLTGIVMLLMSLLLFLQLYILFQTPQAEAPSPKYILGIPGVNPLIPVGFGVIALVFAVVVHEFSHGILARVHGLHVKTMGILLFIIPIGAFVEPDEVELKAAPRRVRTKVFSAGPVSNLFFALVFALIFSGALMSLARPVAAVPIEGVEADGPAATAGVPAGVVITHVNGVRVETSDAFTTEIDKLRPGDPVTLRTHEGTFYTFPTTSCARLYPNDTDACRSRFPNQSPENKTMIGVFVYPTERVHQQLVNPLRDWRHLFVYVGLPFFAIDGQFPLAGHYQDFYETPFHPPTFWFLANLAYWLLWINLMLGLTNALPILPLDGGHIFRDFVGGYLQWRRPEVAEEKRDAIVRRVSIVVALTLLLLVLLPFFGPPLRGLFT